MRDPFIAVDAGTDIRAHARALRRAWEAREPASVRAVISQSWSRMASAGLDPDHLHPRRALSPEAVDDARAASGLGEALPALRRCLGGLALDAEHVMVICDAAGRILWIEGHPRVKHRAEGITFTEGMLWTEDSAGTNAIGTALEIQRAVQVFSAEHFLSEQHMWWCSAAPIHDPATGALLGVVDISGPMRTAHPHSLALVMAAAEMAEDVLRYKLAVEENRLRVLYLERTTGAGTSALVGAGGRVLLAHPAGWIAGPVEIPPGGGLVALEDGRVALAEPLEVAPPAADGAWVLRLIPERTVARPRLRLRLLGRSATAALGEAGPLALSLRHAEILALLALHPDGLTAEQLTLHLYGESGNRISTRAEMSRLRKLLGACLAARPYRLLADLDADFLQVESALAAGDVDAAFDAFRGPLLAESGAPRVAQARDELEGALRRAATGSLDGLWRWLQTEPGRDDLAAMHEFLRRAPAGDPHRALIEARARSLERRWGMVAIARVHRLREPAA
ncbi:GAF domain-containing protein [Candidatus Solirubrobacter pratensis]|uniref:GAF domain-containing protein n=1 Tax=Candidatus Solirubrobacter pratensis TaxID=1298857 RepID=UPI000427B1F7|nr:GAF domain-containing protein [Candidatus Solirubrobacter pratensis]